MHVCVYVCVLVCVCECARALDNSLAPLSVYHVVYTLTVYKVLLTPPSDLTLSRQRQQQLLGTKATEGVGVARARAGVVSGTHFRRAGGVRAR